jgi:hypothetical protein
MKEVIFFGPRNKQLFEDHDFNTELNVTEKSLQKLSRQRKGRKLR